MRFTTTVELGGKTATGMAVPPEVVTALAAGKRPAVRVSLRGYAYRTTIGVMAGRAMLPLSAEHRTAAGVAAGDQVDVEIEVDTAPREVVVPDDLAAALGAAGARPAFDALANSARRAHITNVEGAKAAETRQRRIDKVVGGLAEGGSA